MIKLGDGETFTNSAFLMEKCTHFEAVLSGGFAEGEDALSSKNSSVLEVEDPSDGSTILSVMDWYDDLVDYDSDFDDKAGLLQPSKKRSGSRAYHKVVDLPNFSYVQPSTCVFDGARTDIATGKLPSMPFCCI